MSDLERWLVIVIYPVLASKEGNNKLFQPTNLTPPQYSYLPLTLIFMKDLIFPYFFQLFKTAFRSWAVLHA